MELTNNQKNQIAAMNSSGMSVEEIVKETGLDKQTVTDFVNERNKLHGKPPVTDSSEPAVTGTGKGKRLSAQTKAAMIQWFQSGHSVSQTARKFGVSPTTVRKTLDSVTKPKKKEPASAPTEASSEVIAKNDNNINLQDNNNRNLQKSQAFELVDESIQQMLEVYENMTKAEKRAFDLGEAYRSMLSAYAILEEGGALK